MKSLRMFALALIFIAQSFTSNAQATNAQEDLAWQNGPAKGVIGDKAVINIAKGYVFLNDVETKKFMEMNHNLSSGKEYIFGKQGESWFAVFQFNPTGYVKDDETIDPDPILQSVIKGTEESNKVRKEKGWSTMSITGWRFKPQYDKNNHLLEWAFEAKNDEDNSPVINYNTRLLGRTGVMEVILVASPDELDAAVATLKNSLIGYDFNSGEKYGEFKQGDRVAEYGLAALIAGGAAAVAAKKGFFGAILAFLAAAWKLVIAAVVGFFVWLKSLFSKK